MSTAEEFAAATQSIVDDAPRARAFTSSDAATYTDAAGVERRTVAGMNSDVDALLTEKANEADEARSAAVANINTALPLGRAYPNEPAARAAALVAGKQIGDQIVYLGEADSSGSAAIVLAALTSVAGVGASIPISSNVTPSQLAAERTQRETVDNSILNRILALLGYRSYPGWLRVLLDGNRRLLYGVRTDGTFVAKLSVSLGIRNGLTWARQPDMSYKLSLGTVEGEMPIGGAVVKKKAYAGWLRLVVDSQDRFLEGKRLNGAHVFPKLEAPAFASMIEMQDGIVYADIDANGYYQLWKESRTGVKTQLTNGNLHSLAPALAADPTKLTYVRAAPLQRPVRYWRGADNVEWPVHSSAGIAWFGDSLTAITGPLVAAASPSRSFSLQGIGGQITRSIAQRCGGEPITLGLSGNQIPASGAVSVTVPGGRDFVLYSYDNTAADPPYSARVAITGTGGEVVAGTLTFTTDGGTASFTRDTAGAVVSVATAAPAQMQSGMSASASAAGAPTLAALQCMKLILWAGRNDISGAATAAQMLAMIAAAISARKPLDSHYVVIGITTSLFDIPVGQGGQAADDATALARMTKIKSVNDGLAAAYPGHYVDMVAAVDALGLGLCSSYTVSGMTVRAFNATYSNDGVHPTNTTARNAVRDVVLSKITNMGW